MAVVISHISHISQMSFSFSFKVARQVSARDSARFFKVNQRVCARDSALSYASKSCERFCLDIA